MADVNLYCIKRRCLMSDQFNNEFFDRFRSKPNQRLKMEPLTRNSGFSSSKM